MPKILVDVVALLVRIFEFFKKFPDLITIYCMQKILTEWRKYLAEQGGADVEALKLAIKYGGTVDPKTGLYRGRCVSPGWETDPRCKRRLQAKKAAAKKSPKPTEKNAIEKEAESFAKRKKILNALIKELIEKLVHDVGLGDRESFYRVLYTGPDGDDIESTLNPEKEGDPTYQAQQIINKHEYEQKVGEILKKDAIKIFSEPIWRSDFAEKHPEVMTKLKSVVRGRVLMTQNAKKWHSASYHGESTVPNWPTF